MSDDRELLEAAAKAAGLILDWHSYTAMNIHRPVARRGEDGQGFAWNPLTDDGDALRLAVKMQMPMTVFCVLREPGHADRYAATRLAIVRAAAALAA